MKLVRTSTMRIWEMDKLKDFEVARKIEETQVLRMTDPSAYGCGACGYFSVWFLVFSGVSEAHCPLSPRAVETSVRSVKLKRRGSETVHIFALSPEFHIRTIFLVQGLFSAYLIIATAFLEPCRRLWPFSADIQQLMNLIIDSLYSC